MDEERIAVEYQVKGKSERIYVEDTDLKSEEAAQEIDGRQVLVKEVEFQDPGLQLVRVHVLNLKIRVETPLRIYVTEDFLIDGGVSKIND